ncbi:MAG: hypothetical protein ACR2GQ_08390 [Gemmatimonadota bacterium]
MSLRRHSALVFAALLLGTAAPSAAQQRGAPSGDACLQDRLSPDVAERLRELAIRAAASGVPRQLVCEKVNEGVSKGVRGDRLLRGIAGYVDRLAQARELAGPRAPAAVLEAVAEALERGLPPERIRSFLVANPNPRRSVLGLRVVADLDEIGVPIDEAMRGVNAGLDRGLRGERLLALSAAVRQRVRRGDSPSAALRDELGDRRSPADSRRRSDRRP